MVRVTVLITILILVFGIAASYDFSVNKIGGSIGICSILLMPSFTAEFHYERGFRLSDSWSVGSVDLTQALLYIGPVIRFDSRLFGRGLEFGISGKAFSGIETLSFRLWGNTYMPTIGVRGSFTFSLKTLTFSVPRIYPALGIINISKMTRGTDFSVFMRMLPLELGFELFF